MLKKISVIFLCLTVLFMFNINNVYALSCAGPLSIEENFANNEKIIVGEVTSLQETDYGKVLTVQVKEVLKGHDIDVEEKELKITEDKMWGETQENKTYVFYLKKNGLNQWENPLCSSTSSSQKNIDEAREFALNYNADNLKPSEKEEPTITTTKEDKKETKKEDEKEKDDNSSAKKQVIITSILALVLAVSTSVYFITKTKKDK